MAKRKLKNKSVYALQCIQNEKSFYLTVMSSKLLSEICYISRREENSTKGFQRLLNENRARAIAKYLDIEKMAIPSTLILSAQASSNLSFSETTSKIKFSFHKKSFLVLDGQHRLYGYFLAKKDYQIPVIIFDNLSIPEEVNLFIDINTTQKSVPKTLLLDIKNLTGKENTTESKQRSLFDLLNKNSVMSGLLSASKSQVGKITRVTFNKATTSIVKNPVFQAHDISMLYNAMKNYLEAVERIFIKSKNERAKLSNSMFFRAVLYFFNDVINESLTTEGDLKVETLEKILDPLSRIKYDNLKGSSEASLREIIEIMEEELKPAPNLGLIRNKEIF